VARSADEESFRVCGQDSFDSYATAFVLDRYPGGAGTLEVVTVPGAPHGRCLKVTGSGSYFEDVWYFTAEPEFPCRYARTNELHRDLDSVLVSLWLYVPETAGAFTLIELWGQDLDDRTLTWTLCRLDVAGSDVVFDGGEVLSGGGLPVDQWFQLQFRMSHYSGSVGAGQLKNTCAVRVALPGSGGTTVLGQDEADPDDGWNTILTKAFDVPQYVQIAGVRVGMLASGGGGGDPEAYILVDDYCAGTVDVRYEAAQLFPSGLPCSWQDGLWVEPCRLTGPSEQPVLERTDPGGAPPWPAEGAPTSWEAIDEWPAHDADATRITTAGGTPGPAAEGYAHTPLTIQVSGFGERAYAVSAPCFGALEAADSEASPNYRYCFFETATTDNTLDQDAADAEHYNPIRPPAHPTYGVGVALQWGPQMVNPVLDETGVLEGGTWYYDGEEADATDVFLQAGAGHLVTSLAFEVSHTSEALLPPYPTGGGARTWVVWWP
jgi:hypothetical protein